MSALNFQTTHGITLPCYVAEVTFGETGKTLNIIIDFQRGSRFRIAEIDGDHPEFRRKQI